MSRNLQASREALVAIKGIVGDALASPHCIHQHKPHVTPLTRPELSYGLKSLKHFELCHYLRCDASREVLLMIREAMEVALVLLDQDDESICSALEMAEPYRHHLYTRVTTAALQAAERQAIGREIEYWRQRNAAPTMHLVGL